MLKKFFFEFLSISQLQAVKLKQSGVPQNICSLRRATISDKVNQLCKKNFFAPVGPTSLILNVA